MAISKSARRAVMMPLAQKDVVVETVRAAILSGAMPPGTRINLDLIASEHGTSRMPVRDALHKLETEGLITIYPRRGVQVAQLDVPDMEELFGIRTVLEQKALELAVPRLTQQQFDEMHTLLKRMDWISGRGKAWIGANERFHSILNEASGWPRLISMIKVLRRNIERYIRTYLSLGGSSLAQQQHWDLYRACQAREIERAKVIIAEHSSAAAVQLVAALRSAKTVGVRRK
jgi:DNA-binding GntR family transcriptional regulator